MRATAEVDNLLREIAEQLEQHLTPSPEDSVELEQLRWEYKEFEDRYKLAYVLGLRYRIKTKPLPTDPDVIDALIADGMCPGNKCSYDKAQAASMLRDYLEKKITVSGLFGERDRHIRVSWQLQDTMHHLAVAVRDNFKHLSIDNHDDNGGEMFKMLNELCSQQVDIDMAEKYGIDIKHLSSLKLEIESEFEAAGHTSYSPGIQAWRHAYFETTHFLEP